MKAMITDLKRMAVHDGPGIRTTVFFKGCPLRCLWCHNPETLSRKPQLAYYENKCMGCLTCTRVCPKGAQLAEGETHRLCREKCEQCGLCAKNCPAEALQLFGREVTLEELLPQLLEDRDFYETTGGGVTLSGGECLTQPDFCVELLQALKKEGIHTAVDTCGFVPTETFRRVLPWTDIFLYDIKAIDPEVHKTCTGQDNALILENLRYLDAMGANMEIRIPVVPGHNREELPAIYDFLKTLQRMPVVKELPYHNYAASKYTALNIPNTLP